MRRKNNNSSILKNSAIVFVAFIALLALGLGSVNQDASPANAQTPQVALKAQTQTINAPTQIDWTFPRISRTPKSPASVGSLPVTQYVTSAATFTRAPKPTRTSTPTITATSSATPTSILYKRLLDNPFGTYYKFVVHKAKDGERLETFAEKYNTSVEAILAINYRLTNPVWEDVLFVVPVNFANVSAQPVFVVYQIKEEERGISPDSLAQKLRINPFDLKYYNDMLKPGDRPMVGDLILVPWANPVNKIWWYENNRWDNNKRGLPKR